MYTFSTLMDAIRDNDNTKISVDVAVNKWRIILSIPDPEDGTILGFVYNDYAGGIDYPSYREDDGFAYWDTPYIPKYIRQKTNVLCRKVLRKWTKE